MGDITPIDGIDNVEKHRRERETMRFFEGTLLAGYDGGKAGREIRGLWEEYERGETKESAWVKDVDKFELLVQMVEYEKRGFSGGAAATVVTGKKEVGVEEKVDGLVEGDVKGDGLVGEEGKHGEQLLDLSEFIWVKQGIRNRVVQEWAEEVMAERDEYWTRVGRKPKGGNVVNASVTRARRGKDAGDQMMELQGF